MNAVLLFSKAFPLTITAMGPASVHRPTLRPEYLHVLTNPAPIYALGTAVLLLVAALVLRGRPAQVLALGLIFLSAASAWPTYIVGERAYQQVYLIADNDGQQWLDKHKRRAEKLIYVFYALAAVALSAAIIPIKAPRTAVPLALLTLLIALAALGAGGWIAKAGGQVRHPEFRKEKTIRSSPTGLSSASRPRLGLSCSKRWRRALRRRA